MSLSLHAQIALDNSLKSVAERFVVGALDGVDIGVRSAKKDVVENLLLCPGSGHGCEQVVDIGHKGSAGHLNQAHLEPATGLALNILDKVAIEASVE